MNGGSIEKQESGPRRSFGGCRGARLDRSFRLLLRGSIVSNLGDGVRLATVPLLVQSLTDSKFLIAAVLAAHFLPWLVFAPFGGALVDRWDRRRTIQMTQLWRGVVMLLLGLLVFSDWVVVWHVYVVVFVITTGEILVDPAVNALVPALVSDEDLDRANGQVEVSHSLVNDFAGGPVGVAQFGLFPWLPFVYDGLSYLGSVLFFRQVRVPDLKVDDRETADQPTADAGTMVNHDEGCSVNGSRVRLDPDEVDQAVCGQIEVSQVGVSPDERGIGEAESPGPVTHDVADLEVGLGIEIREGFRWLIRHSVLRPLTVAIAWLNFGHAIAFSVLVILVNDEAGVPGWVYGWMFAAAAGGAFGGALLSRRLNALVGIRRLVAGSALVRGVALVSLSVASSEFALLVGWFVYGVPGGLANPALRGLQQRLTPNHLLGRVNVNARVLTRGSMMVGALVGGVVAQFFGARTAFVVASVALGFASLLSWRAIGNTVRSDEDDDSDRADAPSGLDQPELGESASDPPG